MENRMYSIEFKKDDRNKAYEILLKHWELGNIDAGHATEQKRGNIDTITYWLNLYLSDDLEVIKNEFRENGIELF